MSSLRYDLKLALLSLARGGAEDAVSSGELDDAAQWTSYAVKLSAELEGEKS